MTGMEIMEFEFAGRLSPAGFAPVLAGVVASGNLEVLIEPSPADNCLFHVETSARGFSEIWKAVISDFHERHPLIGAVVSIHDMGATPAVVSLRLEQAASMLAARSEA